MILFPITSQSPSTERFAVEIPETERRRGGLDVNMRLWIILDEYNEDVVGRSYYLEPSALIGKFSRAFFVLVVRQFIERRARAKGINRRS